MKRYLSALFIVPALIAFLSKNTLCASTPEEIATLHKASALETLEIQKSVLQNLKAILDKMDRDIKSAIYADDEQAYLMKVNTRIAGVSAAFLSIYALAARRIHPKPLKFGLISFLGISGATVSNVNSGLDVLAEEKFNLEELRRLLVYFEYALAGLKNHTTDPDQLAKISELEITVQNIYFSASYEDNSHVYSKVLGLSGIVAALTASVVAVRSQGDTYKVGIAYTIASVSATLAAVSSLTRTDLESVSYAIHVAQTRTNEALEALQ